jgi:methylthioribose-1-phosphate isomerase
MLEKNISRMRETAVDAFHSLARYVDAQYQHIVDHMNSATYEAKQDLIQQAKEDTEKLKKLGETSRSDIISFSV